MVLIGYEAKKMKILMSYDKRSKYDPIIYCPDCNEPFSVIEPFRCYCATCTRWYSEDEVRNRCGL